jgi:hypothetical protein
MVTAAAAAMKQLLSQVRLTLKPLGYRKSGSTFNRGGLPDGIIHVINFQMGAFNPPGAVEIPGLRPSLYGRFTINLGVWLPGLDQPGFWTPPVRSGGLVSESACPIRERIGFLLPGQDDTWWSLSTPPQQLADDVSDAISTYALPWLERFAAWDAIVDWAEDAGRYRRGTGPTLLLATRMRLARGEHAEAETNFRAHVSNCVTELSHPGHFTVLTKIGALNSFTVDVQAAQQRWAGHTPMTASGED